MLRSPRHRRFSESGQSLIEVTFAVAVVGLVLVAVLSTVIASMQQARVALEQTQATQHGQAALEWIRSQRDQVGWGSFYAELADKGSDQSYCWSELPSDFDTWLSQSESQCDIGSSDDLIPGAQVTRQVDVQVVSGASDKIELSVTLTRQGQDGPLVNILTSTLEDWE